MEPTDPPAGDGRRPTGSDLPISPSPDRVPDPTRRRLRDLMWDSAGILRRVGELDRAQEILAEMAGREEARWRTEPWSPELLELRNLILTAEVIVACARRRHESRGLHQVVEYPGKNNERFLSDTVIRRGDGSIPS